MKKSIALLIVLTIALSISVAYADIEATINSRIRTTYDAVSVTKIDVNTSIETGKKIVLAYLKWDRDNSLEQSRKMISMYSEDLAAYITQSYDDCERICVFWELPKMYKLDGQPDAKVMFDCKGNAAYFHSATGSLFY